MRPRLFVVALATLLAASGCALGATSAPAPTSAPPPEPPSEPSLDTTEVAACPGWEPASRDWFALDEAPGGGGVEGLEAVFALPASSAARYNTLVEVCDDLWWVLNHQGETRFIETTSARWSVGPVVAPSGSTEQIAAAGVSSGGPTWGFRDSTATDTDIVLSDGVIDTEGECVRVDVHSLSREAVLASSAERSLATRVIYQSTPCVSYRDSYRSEAPLRTHLGGALTYAPEQDAVFLTLGDFHLGASSLAQAAAIGLANTERDYAVLADPASAVGAIVQIPLAGDEPRIVAKGVRNSLGITTTSTGELWFSDHGPSGGDELNLFAEGAKYGWPFTTEGEPYDRSSWPADPNELLAAFLDNSKRDIPGATPPVTWWTPAIAPTAVVELSRSSGEPGLLVIGGLRSEALVVLERDGGTVSERTRVRLGERVRDVGLSGTGSSLLALTDSATLWVFDPQALLQR